MSVRRKNWQISGHIVVPSMAAVAALLLALCCSSALAAAPGTSQVGASVMLLGKFDWEIGKCVMRVPCAVVQGYGKG